MAETLKASKENKIEIVQYCISHGHDYKGTAAKYGGNYAQIYNWVKKYEAKGEDGLTDRRGQRKTEAELTDLERAERRIAELERINKYQEMELVLLKKDGAFDNSYLKSLPKAKQTYLIKQRRISDYSLIKRLHEEKDWSIEKMCTIMCIHRSSYYKWINAVPSQAQINRAEEDKKIIERIKEIAASNNSLFGVMTMYYTLQKEGYSCGHNRVYRLNVLNACVLFQDSYLR